MDQSDIPNQVVVELKDWLGKMSDYKREHMITAMKHLGGMNLSLASVPAPGREKPTCNECGSDEVIADSFSEWRQDLQEWVTRDAFDKGGCCEACGAQDIRFDWVKIDAAGNEIEEPRA